MDGWYWTNPHCMSGFDVHILYVCRSGIPVTVPALSLATGIKLKSLTCISETKI